MKATHILRQNDTALDEPAHNRTYPRMNKQFGRNEDGKCNEKSDMHFNIMKEGKPTRVPAQGAQGGKHTQWQP